MSGNEKKPGEEGLVFCKSFIHHKTGKRVFPKKGEWIVFRPRRKKQG
jgi:hypothetical protein